MAEPGQSPYIVFIRGDDLVVDVLLAETNYQREAMERAVEGIITVEDVIVHKLPAWRARDRDDVASILADHARDEEYIERGLKPGRSRIAGLRPSELRSNELEELEAPLPTCVGSAGPQPPIFDVKVRGCFRIDRTDDLCGNGLRHQLRMRPERERSQRSPSAPSEVYSLLESTLVPLSGALCKT